MSGLMDKAKSAMGKGDSSGGDQAASGGQGADSGVNKYANEGKLDRTFLTTFNRLHVLTSSFAGIDKATDKAGMGDKYDSKIDKVADGQIDKQMGGGKGGL